MATGVESVLKCFLKMSCDQNRLGLLNVSAGHEIRIDEKQHPLPVLNDGLLLASQPQTKWVCQAEPGSENEIETEKQRRNMVVQVLHH